jgi:glycosyltransferase involved in cell wall biosynthesis
MIKKIPLVSVVITTYNRVNLLKRAIISVLEQDYSNIEIIVQDDASSDSTTKYIKELQIINKNLFYFKNDINLGNALTRNKAIKNSNGKYVAFLDDDDVWISKNKLSIQIEALENSKINIGLCCTQAYLKINNQIKAFPIQLPKNMKYQILQGNEVIHNSSVVIKRDIINQIGGFDIKLKRGIDSEFFRNLITRFNYEILFIPVPTIFYETNGNDRITTKKGLKEAKKIFFVHAYILWKYRIQYLKEPKALYIRVKNLILQPIRAFV